LKTASTADRSFVRLLTQEKQHNNKSALAIASILLVLGLLVGWYVIAADYSYHAIAGTYTLKMKDASSTLVLREDQTFQQTLYEHGINKSSQGTWRRLGEGGVVFSSSFLSTLGQEAVASGEVYGEAKKALGIFITIHIQNNANEPVYHKHFLS
jgi:hypothetical protein